MLRSGENFVFALCKNVAPAIHKGSSLGDFWRTQPNLDCCQKNCLAKKGKQWKKRSEGRKHCALAVVRRSQKFSSRRRTPSWGCRMAKISSAGDGHYLHPQTQFGEDRCTQFRVIVVRDPHTQMHKQTHRQDWLQYTVPLSLACSVIRRVESTVHFQLLVVRNICCVRHEQYVKLVC